MLVRESLYNFKRGSDPIQSSGLGKIKLIKDWLEKYRIDNYDINFDLSIDINNSLDMSKRNLEYFPEYIKFNKINGAFFCNDNYFKNLNGFPKIVTSHFRCDENDLFSLYGCPEYVGGNFYCFNNKQVFSKEYVRNLCDVKGEIIC